MSFDTLKEKKLSDSNFTPPASSSFLVTGKKKKKSFQEFDVNLQQGISIFSYALPVWDKKTSD